MSVARLAKADPVPAIEEWLADHGVTEFRFEPRLRLDQIDREASLRNQARLQAIDEDHCIVLAEAVSRGKSMPPIVVWKRPKGYKVLDGNHRVEAHMLNDLTTVAAYVVLDDLSETQEHMLIATANSGHGLPNTLEERVSLAVWLVEHRGTTQAAAAEAAQIPAKLVSQRLNAIVADRRLNTLVGARAVGRLVSASRMRLGAIRSDVVLAEAAKLASDVKLTSPETNALVSEVNRARSEKDQLAVVESARREISERESSTAKNKVPVARPFQNLSRVTGAVLSFDVDALRDAEADRKYTQQMKLRVSEAQAKLAEIAGVL